MKTLQKRKSLASIFMLFMLTFFVAGCGNDDNTTTPPAPTPTEDVKSVTLITTPTDGLTAVATDGKLTVATGATSTADVNASTVNTTTFTLKNGTTDVNGTVDFVNGVMRFKPDANLSASTTYTATVTTGVKNNDGEALLDENLVWSFTTADSVTTDTTSPEVNATTPDANATGVLLNRNISALFNETLDAATVSTATFTLRDNNTSSYVAGKVSYLSKTISFDPDNNLSADHNYTATITTGVTDLADNNLSEAKVWSFTTGTTLAQGPSPVNLGTAGDFVILTKTGISTTGTTAITGDIGVSPIDLTAITGFATVLSSDGTYATSGTSGLLTGKIYAANMASPTPAKMTTAVSDMQIAYTDAAGRTLPDFTELYAGDLSGRTLVPGLYKWGTGVLITGSGTTLSGGADDVWIFQIAENLTIEAGATITLSGGAQAKNIFWQVAGGEGAIIGTGVAFKGILLAAKAATVNTGASVDGRLLVQTAVTLDANTVTQPSN